MTTTVAAQTWNDDGDDSTIVNESEIEGYSATDSALTDDSMSVDMAVTSSVALDVKPEDLNYPDVPVGEREVESERDLTAINLQNTGSEYIDRVWLDASVPSSDPFGTGTDTEHDAGNFIQVRPQDSSVDDLSNAIYRPGDEYLAVNRKEFAIGSYGASGVTEDGNPGQVPNFIVADPGTSGETFSTIDFSSTTGLTSGDNPQSVISDSGNSIDSWSDISLDSADNVQEVHVGSFRVADRDFYYALLLTSENDITSNAELRVADATYEDKVVNGNITEPGNSDVAWHDGSTFGVYDFSDQGAANEPIRWRAYKVQTNQEVGVVENLELMANKGALAYDGPEPSDGVGGNEELREYDVVIETPSSSVAELTRTTFNPVPGPIQDNSNANAEDLESGGFNSATTQYLFDGSGTSSQMLKPGQSLGIDTAIEVPRGVVQGQVSSGTLSIILTSDNTQTDGVSDEEFIHTDQ